LLRTSSENNGTNGSHAHMHGGQWVKFQHMWKVSY